MLNSRPNIHRSLCHALIFTVVAFGNDAVSFQLVQSYAYSINYYDAL